MNTTDPVALAARAERAEASNWLDQHRAAPAGVRAALGLASQDLAGLAMVRSTIPFSHFNMVMTLGGPAPADTAAFDAIDAFYAGGGCGRHWVTVHDHSRPDGLAGRLQARGYRADGAWDRVILQGPRADLWHAAAPGCETVDVRNADDWIAFIRQCYGMPPPIGEWLRALVGRPGWHHAMRRADGVPGAPVVMVRSAYVDGDGWAWLGIDAPVPGVMAPCYDDDRRVTAALLVAAADAGAQCFVSDIEAPVPERQGPAYEAWRSLGFEPAYLRRLFVKG